MVSEHSPGETERLVGQLADDLAGSNCFTRWYIKISSEIHSKLSEEKHDRETWDRFLLRLIEEEATPPGTYEPATISFGSILHEMSGDTDVGLWVEVTTGPDGWVFETKRVEHIGYNIKDPESRARIAEALVDGERVFMYLMNDKERFLVRPQLTWRQDDRGSPIVADVTFRDPQRCERE